MQELARALAHLLEAERQERARAEAQEAEDQQARTLAQLLRVWGAPRTNDPALGLEDDPDAPAAQLARALLRARLDPAALAAQLVPAPAPAPALRPRPPVYDDGPTGPDAEDAGDEKPDLDPELLRSPPTRGGRGGWGRLYPGRRRARSGGGLLHGVEVRTPRSWNPGREFSSPGPRVWRQRCLAGFLRPNGRGVNYSFRDGRRRHLAPGSSGMPGWEEATRSPGGQG